MGRRRHRSAGDIKTWHTSHSPEFCDFLTSIFFADLNTVLRFEPIIHINIDIFRLIRWIIFLQSFWGGLNNSFITGLMEKGAVNAVRNRSAPFAQALLGHLRLISAVLGAVQTASEIRRRPIRCPPVSSRVVRHEAKRTSPFFLLFHAFSDRPNAISHR